MKFDGYAAAAPFLKKAGRPASVVGYHDLHSKRQGESGHPVVFASTFYPQDCSGFE
jgi:hypothetical protein